jgi:hypothetical protein
MAKYDPLRRHLEGRAGANIVMDFREIEDILGFKLPASARTYRAWWANDQYGSHSHARSWLNAGYSVDGVDFVRERVSLRRSP